MARIRSDYVFGTITGALTAGTTTLASAALARLPVVTAPDVAAITLHDQATGVYEIVHVTAHTAASTSATILRAQEGTSAQSWGIGTTWVHGITAYDLSTIQTQLDERITSETLDADTGVIALYYDDTGTRIEPSGLYLGNVLENIEGRAKVNYGASEHIAALSATTGTATGDLSTASIFTITPTGDFTIAFSNTPGGVACTTTVIVSQGATPRTITYPSGTKWMGAAAPTQIANKACVITLMTVNAGTTWYASAAVEQ
jgi:hypothetical protein